MNKLFMKYGLYIPLALVVIFTSITFLTDGTENWIEVLLVNALLYGLGAQALGFAVMHLFKADVIAENIGWEKGSPFQYEVGIANLAIGVLGILCAWFSKEFWLAVVVAAAVWFEGCAVGHIRDMVKNKNFAPGSAGFVFYYDVLFPLALIILLIAYW